MTQTAVTPLTARSGPRWPMLTILALGTVAMTFNWFVMPSAFIGISRSFSLDIPALTLLVSAFVAGYAIMHIPAGLIATRLGLRRTMVLGLVAEGVLTALAGLAPDYTTMVILRILAGIGASIYAGISIAAASAWFHGRDHALALGVVSASFSIGVAMGLYAWGSVINAVGWRAGLGLAGGVAVVMGLTIAVYYRNPKGIDTLAGTRVSAAAVGAVLGNRTLWRYALGFFVGYGGYFVAAQLVATFASDQGYSPEVASLAALMAGVAGLPGSLLVGWLSDRMGRRLTFFVLTVVLQAIGTIWIPLAGESWLWLAAFVVGFAYNGCFAVWQTVPAEEAGIEPEHVGTAMGLMLTIGGVGGFVVPWLFGLLVVAISYTAAWILIGVGTAVSLGFLALRATPVQTEIAPSALAD